jgi:hypothetical protein
MPSSRRTSLLQCQNRDKRVVRLSRPWIKAHGLRTCRAVNASGHDAILGDPPEVQAITVNADANADDRLVWRWSSSGIYSSSLAYSPIFLGQSSILGAKQLWKTKTSGKCRFFFSTVLHGRTWTTKRLFRHGMWDNDSCALCSQSSETVDHLLASCVLSHEF